MYQAQLYVKNFKPVISGGKNAQGGVSYLLIRASVAKV